MIKDLFDMQGQVAAVTGAASGLGLATAEVLARAGARVVLLDVDARGLQAAKQAMRCIAEDDTSHIARIDQAVDTCFKSSDYAEGRRAFAEKRLPQFTGR
jgi:NAD(P)-dependent dehydrogenase (short-subunit alcohol dehydrogenase family)